MATESRISFLEGALTQTSERLRDHTERFAQLSLDIQSLRTEMNANVESLRGEMNANVESLRAEIAALRVENRTENAAIRRESRWIGGIIFATIVAAVIANLAAQIF